jgi:hypothetical protein
MIGRFVGRWIGRVYRDICARPRKHGIGGARSESSAGFAVDAYFGYRVELHKRWDFGAQPLQATNMYLYRVLNAPNGLG